MSGYWQETEYDEEHGCDDPSCRECYPNGYSDGYDVERDEPYGAPVSESAVLIPDVPRWGAIPARRTRLCSVEQETSTGGGYAVERLADRGLMDGNIAGYHCGAPEDARADGRIGYAEEDSSCDIELIYPFLNLSQRGDATAFGQAIETVRDSIRSGNTRLTSRAGFHVHIDARGLAMRHLESLYHLFNALEDPIYRIASARWNRHRDEETGHDYSGPTPKGLDTRGAIGRSMIHQRGALNLMNCLSARSMCHCGAYMFEDWANCRCDLGNCTVEFRVFNATANPTKVRAYVALCQSLVAYAYSRRFTDRVLPALAWQGTQDVSREDERKAALRFLLVNLPFTVDERRALLYCVRNCTLEGTLESLERDEPGFTGAVETWNTTAPLVDGRADDLIANAIAIVPTMAGR